MLGSDRPVQLGEDATLTANGNAEMARLNAQAKARQDVWRDIAAIGATITHLRPTSANHVYLRVQEDSSLPDLCRRLLNRKYRLVTVVGTDERDLVDQALKITYIFSHPTADLYVIVEQTAEQQKGADWAYYLPCYAGLTEPHDRLRTWVTPYERELEEMLGLKPRLKGPTTNDDQREEATVTEGSGHWLHAEWYPPTLFPLRRQKTLEDLRREIPDPEAREAAEHWHAEEREWILPVGPVHAGIIGPGRFRFHLSGEVIEDVDIRLGYTHKGIEWLFQSERSLSNGWQLAQRVAGDTPFAHSLAYCRAAEALAHLIPESDSVLEQLRGLFLELERVACHLADCSALAHDIAYDLPAAEIAALRERLLRVNKTLTGSRLLRGLNRVRKLELHEPVAKADLEWCTHEIKAIGDGFARLAGDLRLDPRFRGRLQWIGVLTRQQALVGGATGLIARASGIRTDSRLLHPTGIYGGETISRIIEHDLDTRFRFGEHHINDPFTLYELLRRPSDDVSGDVSAYLWSHANLASITDERIDERITARARHIEQQETREPAARRDPRGTAFRQLLSEHLSGALDNEDLLSLLSRLRSARLPWMNRRLKAALLPDARRDADITCLNRRLLEQLYSPHIEAGRDIDERERTAGDALARFHVRVDEVKTSITIIQKILPGLCSNTEVADPLLRFAMEGERIVRNYEFGLGHAEGSRGDIYYWLMADRSHGIFRCKVRDPSLVNWPLLRKAITPHELDSYYRAMFDPAFETALTMIGDFPIVNKSFGLSYSGNDL